MTNDAGMRYGQTSCCLTVLVTLKGANYK